MVLSCRFSLELEVLLPICDTGLGKLLLKGVPRVRSTFLIKSTDLVDGAYQSCTNDECIDYIVWHLNLFGLHLRGFLLSLIKDPSAHSYRVSVNFS